MAGVASDADELAILHGSLSEGRFLAVYSRNEILTAVLGFDSPKLVAQYRALLARGATLNDAHALAMTLTTPTPALRELPKYLWVE